MAQGGDLPDLERRIILASAGTAEELRPNVKAVKTAGLIWATDACLTQKAALSVANIYAGSEAGSIEDQGRKYYDIVLQAYEEAQRNPGVSKELARLARNETGGFGPVVTDAGPGDQQLEKSAGPGDSEQLDHLQHNFTERERMRAFRDPYKYLTILDKNEGGYVNHPDDKGGETYRGVSRNTWGNWPGWELIDAAKAAGITKPPVHMPVRQQSEDFFRR